MVFSSSLFLFLFLPLTLLFYFNPLNRMPIRKLIAVALFCAVCLLSYVSPVLIPVWVLFLTASAGVLLIVAGKPTEASAHGERSVRNLVLLIASLLFYAAGEPKYILLLLLSIAVNWGFGLWAGRHAGTGRGKWIVAADLLYNIAVFFVFKYMDFVFGYRASQI